MNSDKELFKWSEKYRPQTLEDCILPENLKDVFRGYIKDGEITDMIFAGTSGVGKTTAAKAICNDLGCDYIVINGSSENGIDVLRTKITAFAQSVSLNGKPKVVIIDEADGLNSNSIQPALRAFIEEYSANCRFIFTCNFSNKLIKAIHSRAPVIEFKLNKEDKPAMAAKFMKRITQILELEEVEADKKVVAQVLTKYFPDYRRVLNELQQYSKRGSIDEGILAAVQDVDIKEVISALKEKDFKKVRQWVENNSDNDVAPIYRSLYNALYEQVVEVPQMILIIADYSYKSYFVVDQMINMSACLVEIMGTCSFKK